MPDGINLLSGDGLNAGTDVREAAVRSSRKGAPIPFGKGTSSWPTGIRLTRSAARRMRKSVPTASTSADFGLRGCQKTACCRPTCSSWTAGAAPLCEAAPALVIWLAYSICYDPCILSIIRNQCRTERYSRQYQGLRMVIGNTGQMPVLLNLPPPKKSLTNDRGYGILSMNK